MSLNELDTTEKLDQHRFARSLSIAKEGSSDQIITAELNSGGSAGRDSSEGGGMGRGRTIPERDPQCCHTWI